MCPTIEWCKRYFPLALGWSSYNTVELLNRMHLDDCCLLMAASYRKAILTADYEIAKGTFTGRDGSEDGPSVLSLDTPGVCSVYYEFVGVGKRPVLYRYAFDAQEAVELDTPNQTRALALRLISFDLRRHYMHSKAQAILEELKFEPAGPVLRLYRKGRIAVSLAVSATSSTFTVTLGQGSKGLWMQIRWTMCCAVKTDIRDRTDAGSKSVLEAVAEFEEFIRTCTETPSLVGPV